MVGGERANHGEWVGTEKCGIAVRVSEGGTTSPPGRLFAMETERLRGWVIVIEIGRCGDG